MNMNLLDDALFTVRTSSGREQCSLPRMYELLFRDEVEGFPRLQAHQKQAWHCFLAQLGAIATEDRSTPESAREWHTVLSSLASREAWNLHTEELSEPAFMQPPVPEDSLDGWKEIHVTEYDVPTLSKNHALKAHRMHRPNPEHWAYLLINVQTTGFYAGSGSRGVSRMNGGYGARPFFGLTPSLRPGKWIQHDVRALRDSVADIEKRYDFEREQSPLLWTIPWNGEDSLDLTELHPLYVECARRIRHGDTWRKTGTSAERVTGAVNGQTGDPWAPVNEKENKVLNPSPADFQYRRLAEILFGDTYRLPASFSTASKGYIVCRAVFTDPEKQGGTRDHYRERIIPFSNRRKGWNQVEKEARERVKKAESAASILSHALYLLLKEDRDDGQDEKVPDLLQKGKNRRMNAFHSTVDEHFFEKLFQAPVLDDDVRQTFWHTFLVDALHAQMDEARSLCPAKDRWKRLGRAQTVMENRIRTALTYAKQIDKTDGNGGDEHAGREHGGDEGGETSQHDAEAVQSL